MAEDTTIGLKIVAETDSFNMAMKKTKENIKQLGANFKESVASLDRWSQSTDGLEKKIDSLNGEMAEYKTQMDITKREIEKLSENEEANAQAIEKKRKVLQEANTKYQEANQNVAYYTSELAKAKQKEDEQRSSLGQLTATITEQENKLSQLGKQYKNTVLTYGKNSKEAKKLASQIKSTSKELAENKKKANEADKAIAELGEASELTGKSLSTLESVGNKAKGAFKAVATGAVGLIASLVATASSTRDLRTNLGKLDTAFETNGFSAETARDIYKELYGVLGDSDQATEAANLLASLATSEEDLAEWTDILTGVYGTFGDSLPVESLAEAANETAKTGKITGALADALNWAGISEDKFQQALDKCNTEAEREELIRKTLNKTYGEASKKYKENNKDIIASNKAQAELSERMAELGEKVEPLMTTFKEMGVQLLDAIMPVVDEWMPKIQSALQWILDNKDALIAGLAGIGVAMATLNVANMIFGLVKAFKAFKTAQEGATLAQWLLNAAMSANPIGIVIALIAGLVTAFVILWNKSEAFREFWKGLWGKIKSACSVAISAIAKFFSKAWDDAKKAWSTAKSWFSNLMQKIVEAIKNQVAKIKGFFSKAWDNAKNAWSTAKSWFSNTAQKVVDGFKSIPSKIKEFFSNAWDNAKSAWSNVKSFFTGKLNDITSAFTDLPTKMGEIGKNMIEGMWNGIKDMTSWITDKLKGFGDSVLGGIKKFFGIHSPSTVMRDEVGRYLAEGVAEGIDENTDTAVDSMETLGDKVLDSMVNLDGTEVKNSIDELVDWLFSPDTPDPETSTVVTFWDKVAQKITNFQKKIGLYEWTNKVASKALSTLSKGFDTVTKSVTNVTKAFAGFNDQLTENQLNELDTQLEQFQQMKDEEIAIQEEAVNRQLALLEEQQRKGLIYSGEYNRKRQELEDDLASFTEKRNAEVADKEKELQKEKDRIAKKQFESNQRNSIAQALIDGASAMIKNFAQYGWIAGGVMNIAQGAATAMQVATIKAQKFTPALAKGGVVDSATLAMIGEAGKEAVIPLEKNTGWMDELAHKLSAIMHKDYLRGLSQQYAVGTASVGAVSNVNNFTQVINAPKTPSRRELYRDGKNLLALGRA